MNKKKIHAVIVLVSLILTVIFGVTTVVIFVISTIDYFYYHFSISEYISWILNYKWLLSSKLIIFLILTLIFGFIFYILGIKMVNMEVHDNG